MTLVFLTAAGHGGPDPGAPNPHNPSRPEKVINLEIDAEFERLARLNGHTVHRMRKTDVAWNPDDLPEMAAKVNADVVYEFHCNASPSPSVRGIEALVYPYGKGASVVDYLIDRLSLATGMPARQPVFVWWDRFSRLKERLHLLSENGFITNYDDELLLRSPVIISHIARVHLATAHWYFGLGEPKYEARRLPILTPQFLVGAAAVGGLTYAVVRRREAV